jgi:hypothetical protein
VQNRKRFLLQFGPAFFFFRPDYTLVKRPFFRPFCKFPKEICPFLRPNYSKKFGEKSEKNPLTCFIGVFCLFLKKKIFFFLF